MRAPVVSSLLSRGLRFKSKDHVWVSWLPEHLSQEPQVPDYSHLAAWDLVQLLKHNTDTSGVIGVPVFPGPRWGGDQIKGLEGLVDKGHEHNKQALER